MNELINFAGKATVIYFAVFCLFYISDKRRIINGVLLTIGLFGFLRASACFCPPCFSFQFCP